ncbi:hypothetical protein [Thalassotalea sp. Y01]|uniref:hypothetical protein n=1 Tax=Thalassotalea sp. Y01 TaxID=2729613 RepID=UPI00145C55AB|nr:hypothetical protein [Thalassotalea sp. Y01]NMP17703.1 hypothetical protein [Thalassotalea sp. Y01]
MQNNLHRRDWFGIAIGIIIGIFQTFTLIGKEFDFPVQAESLFPIAIFGLGGPPLLAIVNKLFKTAHLSIQVPRNIIFMIIAMGLSTGAVGLVYHFAVGLPVNSMMPIVFLGSAGFGFIFAYFIYPDLGYREGNT